MGFGTKSETATTMLLSIASAVNRYTTVGRNHELEVTTVFIISKRHGA